MLRFVQILSSEDFVQVFIYSSSTNKHIDAAVDQNKLERNQVDNVQCILVLYMYVDMLVLTNENTGSFWDQGAEEVSAAVLLAKFSTLNFFTWSPLYHAF